MAAQAPWGGLRDMRNNGSFGGISSSSHGRRSTSGRGSGGGGGLFSACTSGRSSQSSSSSSTMGKVAVFIGVAVAIGVAIVVIGGILSLDTATEERLVDVDFNLAEVKSEVMEDVVQLKRLDEELKRQRQVQVGHRAQIQQLQQQQNAMVAKLDGSVRTLEKSIAQLSANVSHVSEPLKKASEGCALFPSERVCV